MDSETDTGSESPAHAVWDRTTATDLLLVLSVPAVLLAVASLPLGTRERFVFEYADPTLRSALFSTFVHLGPRHLAVNLVGYALVVPVAYCLSVATGRRGRFRVAFVALLVACPVVLSYLNLAIVRDGGSAGFSGVLLALYGYLPLAIGGHAERVLDIGVERTTAPLLFFIGLTVIALLTLSAVLTTPVAVTVGTVAVPVTQVLVATLVGLIAVLALVLVLYGVTVGSGGRSVRAALGQASKRTGQFELAVVATALFLAFPLATFPVDPVVTGRVVNLYVHLLGYALGFIGAYVTVLVESALFESAG
jgi:hypothetical protein